jgi:hypothetical protein
MLSKYFSEFCGASLQIIKPDEGVEGTPTL